MFLKKIKMFQKAKKFIQRGKQGYCYEDLWDLYNWFTLLFPKMLQDFLKNSHGYPAPMCPSDIKNQEEWYEEHRKKWEYEVNKLIYFLKEANDETCSHQNNIDYNMNTEFVETEDDIPYTRIEFSFPTKEDEQKWEEHKKRDKEIFQYRKESFEKALKQFNAIARNLWD